MINIKKQNWEKTAYISINATRNNTLLHLASLTGHTLAWSCPAILGFNKGKRKTPYAAYLAGLDLRKKAKKAGIRNVYIFFKGIGRGKLSAIKGLRKNQDIKIIGFKDRTPVPFNGCRPPKQRRL